jgi:hypothetical protein
MIHDGKAHTREPGGNLHGSGGRPSSRPVCHGTKQGVDGTQSLDYGEKIVPGGPISGRKKFQGIKGSALRDGVYYFHPQSFIRTAKNRNSVFLSRQCTHGRICVSIHACYIRRLTIAFTLEMLA